MFVNFFVYSTVCSFTLNCILLIYEQSNHSFLSYVNSKALYRAFFLRLCGTGKIISQFWGGSWGSVALVYCRWRGRKGARYLALCPSSVFLLRWAVNSYVRSYPLH